MVCFGSSTSHPPQKHARKKQAAERHLKNSAPMLRRESKVGESLDKHLFIQNCRNWTDNVSCWSNTLAMWGHCLRAGPGDCEALKLRWVYHNRAGGRGVQESATAWYCELSHWLCFLQPDTHVTWLHLSKRQGSLSPTNAMIATLFSCTSPHQ